MIEAHTKILRHIIDCDGKLDPECYNRVFLASPVDGTFFNEYDPKTNTFTDTIHALVFDHARAYFDEYGRPPTDDSMGAEIADDKALDAFAKRDVNNLLRDVRRYTARANETPLLVDQVREQFLRDRQVYVIQRGTKMREEKGVTESYTYVLNELSRLTARCSKTETRGAKSAAAFADEVIEKMKHSEELVTPCARWGFRKWDRYTGGLYPGTVTAIGAGLSVGKSWVLGEVSLVNAIDLGKRVVLWNLEMLEEQVAQRIICRQTGISLNVLRGGYGNLTMEEREKFDQAQQGIRELGERVLFLDKSRCSNFSQVKAEMVQHFGTKQVDLLMCDYLDKVHPSRGKYSAPHERVSLVSSEAKDFALENQLALLTATQNNRKGNKNPDADINELSNLQVAKDADTLVMLAEDPDNPYVEPDPEIGILGTPGILTARFVRGRAHGKQHGEPFRLSVEFATGKIAECSDFNRSAVAAAYAGSRRGRNVSPFDDKEAA